VNMTFPRILHR